MTIIRFEYKHNYHVPASGGLVFMPHRRHAANETEVLPKPFHKTLVDGVVEVDLEPTGDDWVWSVSLGDDTRFYAVPDHTGIVPHTDLIPVAPSTLDHRVESVWWAELRQIQQFMGSYIEESRSNVDEAISTVNSIHQTLTTAVTDAQRHESVAGAYSRQAQTSAADAWEASKGPDGAAARAKADADRAAIYREETNLNRQRADNAATTAGQHADTAANHAHDAQTSAANAHARATDAANSATAAQNAQQAAETARDEATTGPESAATRAETSATNAQDAATRAQTSADNAATAESNATNSALDAATSADNAATSADNATTAESNATTQADRAEAAANNIDITEWTNVEPLNGWTVSPQARWRLNHGLLEIIGRFDGSNATDNTICQLPQNAWYTQYFFIETGNDTPARATFSTTGEINIIGQTYNHNRVSINERLEQREP